MSPSLRPLTLPALLVAALALASLTSCETPTATAATPSKCGPYYPPDLPLPTIKPWDGTPLSLQASSSVIIERNAQYPGSWVAWQVEWTGQAIPRAVYFPDGKLPQFVDSSQLASILIRHPTPPPPPVQPDELLRAAYAISHPF